MLWYWAQFGVAGGPKTLVLQRTGPVLHGAAAGRRRCNVTRERCGASDRIEADGANPKRAGVHRPAQGSPRPRTARWRSPLECSCMSRFALVLAVAALAGCGGGEHGTATVWITRDQGTHVLLSRSVPAGLTAMQALDRVADIKTRYAGRFVQSIDGIDGSVTARRDWFYFVNGYEGDRSAAEYRLRDGDVEWWDFRSWAEQMHVPVVVGAFPEPFLHGFGGKTLPAECSTPSRSARVAERVAKLVRGRASTRAVPSTRRNGQHAASPGPSSSRRSTAVASQSSRPGSARGLRLPRRSRAPSESPADRAVPVRGATVRPRGGSRPARRARGGGAPRRTRLVGGSDRARADPRLPARSAFASALLPDRDTAFRRRAVRGDAVRRDDRFASGLDRSDHPGSGPARHHARGARSAALKALSLAAVGFAFAAYALLLDHDRILRSVRLRANGSPCDAPVADARAGCDGVRRVSARQGNRGDGGARSRGAPLASARELARARAEPRGGDGGAWLRQGGRTSAPRPPWRARDTARGRAGGVDRDRGGAVALAHVERFDVHVSRRRLPGAPRRLARDRRGGAGRRLRHVRVGQVDACCGHCRGSFPTSTVAASKVASRSPAVIRARSGRPSSPEPSRPSFRIPRSRSCSRTSHARWPSGSRISALLRTRSCRGRTSHSRPSVRCRSSIVRCRSSQGASCSALPWPRRLRCDRGCSCWTSRPRSSTPLPQSRSSSSSPSWVSPS